MWSEVVLRVYSPMDMLFLRLCITSVLLYLLFRKKLQKIAKTDYVLVFLMAFCEPFIYFVGESYGIKYSGAGFASIMIALIPLLTPVAATIFLNIKSHWLVFVGLIVAFIGILMMILGGQFQLIVDIRGILCLSLAVISAVGYAMCVVKVSQRYNNFTIVFVQTFIAAVLFCPLFFTFGWSEFIHTPFHYEVYVNLLLLAVLGSGLAFLCFVESVKRIGPVKTTMFSNFIPIITAIGAYFIMNESIKHNQLIGIFIVIVGLFIGQWNDLKTVIQKKVHNHQKE